MKKKYFCIEVLSACLISEYFKKHLDLIKWMYFLIKPGLCLLSLLHLTGVILSWAWAVRGWPGSWGCEVVLHAVGGCEQRYCCLAAWVQRTASYLGSWKALDSLAWKIFVAVPVEPYSLYFRTHVHLFIFSSLWPASYPSAFIVQGEAVKVKYEVNAKQTNDWRWMGGKSLMTFTLKSILTIERA